MCDDSNNNNNELNKHSFNLCDEGNKYRHFSSESAKEFLKEKCGLDDDTIQYLSSYKNYDKLLIQIANKIKE